MKCKIGFLNSQPEGGTCDKESIKPAETKSVRPSVVLVHFPKRNLTLSYYNDSFDVHRGDLVYVEGKLEGERGHVLEVSYSFKIKRPEYKCIIAVADTKVSGEFFMAGSHVITFDAESLPYEKVCTWFQPPEQEENYTYGNDDAEFLLSDLSTMKVSGQTAEDGQDYFLEDKVIYLSLDQNRGRALVQGSRTYSVEFVYEQGVIRNLVCDCFEVRACRHSFAVMLQLRECLHRIEERYSQKFEESGYFAAVSKPVLYAVVVDPMDEGRFVLDI